MIANSYFRAFVFSVLVLAGALGFQTGSGAATYSKANNADNINLTTSWTGGVVPTNTDVGQWSGTVTSANTVSLGANLKGVEKVPVNDNAHCSNLAALEHDVIIH
jgi:hypothetical protein